MATFKDVLDQYCELDNQIRKYSKKAYELREQREFVVNQMRDYMQSPEYSFAKKIERGDGSRIIIHKPNETYKASSFTKGKLEDDVQAYFANNPKPNAEGCIQYIFEKAKERSVCKEFTFTRVVPGESENGT